MTGCVLCGEEKYPYQSSPNTFDHTQRSVRIWWDTSVWICYECWCKYRVDALLAPIRFMMQSNKQYREDDERPDD